MKNHLRLTILLFLFAIPTFALANSFNSKACYPSVKCSNPALHAYGSPIECRPIIALEQDCKNINNDHTAFSCTAGCYTTTSPISKAPSCPVVTLSGPGTIVPALTWVRNGDIARIVECGSDLVHSFYSGLQISSNGEISNEGPQPLKLIDSVVMGSSQNIATGAVSLAAGYLTSATGSRSAAFGTSSTASGPGSFAAGEGTNAKGTNAFSLGFQSEASGNRSISTGDRSVASGTNAIAFGERTIAQSLNSVAIGRYNVGAGNSIKWEDEDPLFVIGNGTSDTARQNAVTVFKNGNMSVGTTGSLGRVHGQHKNGHFGVLGYSSVLGHSMRAVYGRYDSNNWGYIGGSNIGVRGAGSDYGVRGSGNYGVRGFGTIRGLWGSGGTGVYANGTEYGIYSAAGRNYFNGWVGIGNTNPAQALQVTGNAYVTGRISAGYSNSYLGGAIHGEHDANNLGYLGGNGIGVYGKGTNYGIYSASGNNYFSGRVGIGTSLPSAGLHVRGSGWPNSFLYLDTDAKSQDSGIRLMSGGNVRHHIYNKATDDNPHLLRIETASGNGIAMDQSGYVGINTQSPQYPLHVNGKATASAFGTVMTKNQTFTNVTSANIKCDGGNIAISCGGYSPDGLKAIMPSSTDNVPNGCTVEKIGGNGSIYVYATCWNPSL